jgi:hypothetical protein
VILLVHDLHVRVIDAATGELLRDLIVDPTGLSAHRRAEGTNSTQEIVTREGSEVSYVSRDHKARSAGFEPATF